MNVLGPGRRIGIWVQGCSIHCSNCVSQDTWEKDDKRSMRIADILAWCRNAATQGLDGITISGGEPFDQPQGLRFLLAGLHAWRLSSGNDFDILCYSGYQLRALETRHGAILKMLDAIIPGPYIEDAPPTAIWCGSANQNVVALNERGRQKYAPYLDLDPGECGKRMQMAVEGHLVWMIGIPARGDMERLEAICRSRGLSLDQVSWRR